MSSLDPIAVLRPILEDRCLQDLLPLISQYFARSISKDERLHSIGKWKAKYSDPFNEEVHQWLTEYNSHTTMELNDYERVLLSQKIVDKYHDFDNIIMRTSAQMNIEFQESGKSKLRADGIPDQLTLKNFRIDGSKLRFTIIVGEVGKGHKHPRYYYKNAGNFFVEWF